MPKSDRRTCADERYGHIKPFFDSQLEEKNEKKMSKSRVSHETNQEGHIYERIKVSELECCCTVTAFNDTLMRSG